MNQRNPLVVSDAPVASFSGTVTRRKTRATVTAASQRIELSARGSKLLGDLIAASPEDVAAIEEYLERLHGAKKAGSELISPADAAALLGVSRPTVVRWVGEGLLTDHPVGSHHKVDRAEVVALKQQRRAQAAANRDAAARERADLLDAGVDLEVAPTPAELAAAGAAARAGDRRGVSAVLARQRRQDARKSAAAAGESDAS